ncbi:flagellar protein FlaG [Thermoanaerobacter wiegelii]|uniref:Flagellar protein FlaG protein n=1 Tax=Thermoanaerobacter wiegelii Rt8.B1 TaxID=697303 RepID=G2MQY9_9THEO|nr:flagellar protein FlaG [Thermoanaerobacter wiegelii]AEM78038.1 flagellar protein FlaG protein [Thermoanaerobacter wiegelii Rt8.B1]
MLQGISTAGTGQVNSQFKRDSALVEEIKAVKDILSKPVDEDKLNSELNKENRKISINDHTYFEFSVHKPTNTIVVKIVDSDTNEVIDEIPPEKILDLVAGLWKIAGLFVDRKI